MLEEQAVAQALQQRELDLVAERLESKLKDLDHEKAN